MTRTSTEIQDKSIIRLFQKGLTPKRISFMLNLSSVWVVYNAIRRFKEKLNNQIEQIESIEKID